LTWEGRIGKSRIFVEWPTQAETSLEENKDTLCDLGIMDYKMGYICGIGGIDIHSI
jgi:hypothetical protein